LVRKEKLNRKTCVRDAHLCVGAGGVRTPLKPP
jgi:hypothetical protein